MKLSLSPVRALASTSVAVLLAASGCSSKDDDATPAPSATASPPAAPTWDGAAPDAELYEGRTTSVAFRVRGEGAASLVAAAVTSGKVEAEVVDYAADPADPTLGRGTLVIRVGYALDGAEGVRVALTGASGEVTELPITVAKVHPLAWLDRIEWKSGAGPGAREHGLFFYDRAARAVFLLQGGGYQPWTKPVEDAWRLDLAARTWSPWTPTGDVPVPALGRRGAEGDGVSYVHGGTSGFEETKAYEKDLFRVDVKDGAKAFTKLTAVGEAPARHLHVLAYDAPSKRVAVFGGVAMSGRGEALANTTVLGTIAGDTVTWAPLAAEGPGGRYGAFHAFDAEARRLVVWSGGQRPTPDGGANPAADAWALDMSAETPTWSKLAPSGTPPRGRRNGCAMHDPIGRRLFVYGGTFDGKTTEPGLFVLDLTPGREAWTELQLENAPALRSSGFGFATEDGSVVCAFGNDKKVYTDVSVLGHR